MTVTEEQLDTVVSELGQLAQRHYDVAQLTTYKVGGTAAIFVKAENQDDLLQVAAAVRGSYLPMIVLGRGSNTLFGDGEFRGVVLQLGDFFNNIEIPQSGLLAQVNAGASVPLPVLARRTAGAGLSGLEWGVGVPGSIGGAIRMNAGGHGSDMAQTLIEVSICDVTSCVIESVPASEVGLRFRGSNIQDHQIVLSARFELTWGDRRESESMIDDIVKWRRDHQPGGQNAGSVFVNPIPGEVTAGQLIDDCGLRGFRIGTAEVSSKHANFIQADVDGRAGDVLAVMRHVRQMVHSKYGFELRSEVRLVGASPEFS